MKSKRTLHHIVCILLHINIPCIAHIRLLPEYRSPAAMDLMLAAQQMVAAQAAAQAATAAYYQHTVSTTAAATSAAPGAPVFAPPINHMRMNPQAPPAPGFGLLPAPPMNLGMGGMGQPPPPPPPQQALNQHAFGDHATSSGNDYNQCVFQHYRYRCFRMLSPFYLQTSQSQ